MYPHTITIFHKESTKDEDTYTAYILSGVYVHSSRSLSFKGTRFSEAQGVEIDVNKQLSDSYLPCNEKGTWTVSEGDRVVQGEDSRTVTSFKDLKGAMVVTGVDINLCGSPLDNIVLRCN